MRSSSTGLGTERTEVRCERGGALLELAVSIPIFIIVLALIFDAGLGFSAARDTSSAARSAARVAALAGSERLADYRAIDAVRAEYADSSDTIVWLTIYRSVPGGDGLVPAGCEPGGAGVAGLCNVYDGATISTLVPADFSDPDCADELDANWCPTTREDDDGDYLGVGLWATHDPTVGIVSGDGIDIEDRAVFALYFPDAVE